MAVKCKRCKEEIKGRIAYHDMKPYCQTCHEIIKWKKRTERFEQKRIDNGTNVKKLGRPITKK